MPNSKQIVYLSQSQYAELIANGTITVNGVTVTYDENDIYVTPQAEPVTDVRVNNVSVAANGVANIPASGYGTYGVVKLHTNVGNDGLRFSDGNLGIYPAFGSDMKQGRQIGRPITPSTQDSSTFYGLAKAAGHDEASSTEPLGTYTPEAKGAIQQMLGVSDLIGTSENNLVASKAYKVGEVFTANGKLYKATAAIAADAAIITDGAGANCEETSVGEGFPHDVQVNGVSVVSDGVANLPIVGNEVNGVGKTVGMVRFKDGYCYGFKTFLNGNDYCLAVRAASENGIKTGKVQNANGYGVIDSTNINAAAFYGLAKAAGDTTQSSSSNAVGTYTDNAKASIKSMLGIVDGSTGTVDITGTTPTINAVENTRYVCGEVTSLSFTPPSSGISIVRFTSGSTVTVLTIPSTVKFPEWFDPTALETNTIYEICITDGTFGAVMSWAL